MKRQSQEAVRERLKGMTREQKLAYWQQRYAEMQTKRDHARASKKSA